MEDTRVPLYPVEKDFKPTTVCVTGATGYIAGTIVQRLLASGHTVHATCRNPAKEASVAHLKAFPGADERLKLFQADLMQEGSFAEAVNGCSYVMHTASPFIASAPKGKERELLIDPAVKGTENVLGAVNATESVKRVILTSSCAAIYGDPTERGADHVFTEEDWSVTPTETNLAYFYSKRVAEERAHEMSKAQDRWDLVVINPAGVFGPPTSSRADGESINLIKMLMTGKVWPVAPKVGMGIVDVRDVAAAHTVAMADKNASGRYILSSESLWYLEIGNILREKYHKCWLPKGNAPKAMMHIMGPMVGVTKDFLQHLYGKMPVFDNSRIKGLGLTFVDVKVTMIDMVESMGELGILTLKK